jgi:hypothetical protein
MQITIRIALIPPTHVFFLKNKIYKIKQVRPTFATMASILCINEFCIGLHQNNCEHIIINTNIEAKTHSYIFFLDCK